MTRHTARLPLLTLTLLLAVVGAACDLFESVTAKTVVAGSVFAGPEIDFQGYFAVPSETAASMWVGERDSELSTSEPTPIVDANVSIVSGGQSVALPHAGDGAYAATSLDSDLSYAAGNTYEFNASIDGKSYGGTTQAPPQLSLAAVTFSPAPSSNAMYPAEVLEHPKSTALTVTWDPSYGDYAYVSVFRADPATPDRPELVFDTRPKSVGEILDFVTGNPPTQIDIPADTFAADGLYAVVLLTANNGEKSDDVFGVSAFLVGSGVAQLLVVGQITL